LVLFDVSRTENARRNKLRRYLRERGFGCLQGSVWITPDPLLHEREVLAGGPVDAKSLMLLEGRPCGDESNADLVNAAWDFEKINACYTQCLDILQQFPTDSLKDRQGAVALQCWAKKEQAAWRYAVAVDPLLPAPILPQGYLGQHTWQRRVQVLQEARRKLPEFAR
jgi:DNA-binding transcriptional regulator PaaX